MAHTQEMSSPGYTLRRDELTIPPLLNESARSKSDFGYSLPTPDDSPPRPEERKTATSSLKVDSSLLSLEETTELFRSKIEDARRDTQQLAGSEEVSEVVKPKLTLNLGQSNISRIPEAVVDLIKAEVERLSLSHNQIWHIPLRFSECSHLRYLNIRSNVFRELPRGIYKLPLLEILDISRNKVRKIPKDIANLTSLRVLSIVHNRIDELPTEICEMSKLHVIKIAENPLRGRLKIVVENKEAELTYTDVTDNEREQAVTTEIKRFLRESHPVPVPLESDSTAGQEDISTDAPKPLKRVMSSRFPVVPSGSSMDATGDLSRSSPNGNKPPPIPTRSHFRVASGQMSNGNRRLSAAPTANIGERNRSNSDGSALQTNGAARPRRMGILRKEKSDLDAIDETKVFRQNHHRGFSHGSALRRNGSISSPLIGTSSPNSPRVYGSQMTPTMKRLSSLPEGRNFAAPTNPIIQGAKGLLYSLHQIEFQIRGLIAVVETSDAKRGSLEFTFYNASKWLKRLNKTLERAVAVDPEDTENMEKAQDSVQQYCVDCVMAYKHVISQLQDNVKRIVAGIDPMYIRTLMLLLFGSIMEIKNAMKSFGIETRGHRRQMSSGNTHSIETIPEEFTTPQQPVRASTPSRGRSATRLQGGRYRSDTTIQLPILDHLSGLQPVQPPQPPGSARLPPSMQLTGSTLNGGPPSSASSFTNNGTIKSYGLRSRSNSRTNLSSATNSAYSSIANTPRSGEGFNLPPPSHVSDRVNPATGMTEIQEESCFEQIYHALSKSYEIALQAVPIARKQFQRCLEAAEENRQPKELRDLWSMLVHRCKLCQDVSEALQMRLTNMPHKDSGYGMANIGSGRNDPSFWLLCKAFLQSFIDLVTDMREAKELRLLPAEILIVLRPVQKASRDAGHLMENSPWRHMTDGVGSMPAPTPFSAHGGNPNQHVNGYSHAMNGGLSTYSTGLSQQLQQTMYHHQAVLNIQTPASSSSGTLTLQPSITSMNGSTTINGASPTVQLPATPLSAALGPAAQATIPSTPASAYGDQFFKGDVFQRADSLLSMPQAGSVNFLNRR